MNKMSGLGLSVLTVASLASLSSSVVEGSFASNIMNPQYHYESISIISDESGALCLSSNLSERVSGDILLDKNDAEENYLVKHEKVKVQLQITDIKKHVSRFDFEEEYEEI